MYMFLRFFVKLISNIITSEYFILQVWLGIRELEKANRSDLQLKQ